MRVQYVLVASVVAVGVSVAAIVAFLFLATDPWTAPGETWTRGLLAGDRIRLLASGKFVHEHWCDVCMDNPLSFGRWERKAGRVVLHPDSPIRSFRSLELVEFLYGKCSVLVEPPAPTNGGEINPLTVFSREGQSCPVPN